MIKLGVLVSGSGSNLQAIIDEIASKRLEAEIKVVISNKGDAYGLTRAKDHGIPSRVITKEAFPDKEAFDGEITRTLKESGVELVVLAGYMRLLSPSVIRAFPMRIMNIHPALLPSFTGVHVQQKALEYGVKFTGATVHFVDEGLDTGPIIIQAVVPVLDGDTAPSLSKRILAQEHRIYPEAIRLFAEGSLTVEGRRVFVKNPPRVAPPAVVSGVRGATPAGAAPLSLENPCVRAFEETKK